MDGGVIVDFSILPSKDGGLPPNAVHAELVDQIEDLQSALRQGRFGKFLEHATVKSKTAKGIDVTSDLGDGSSGIHSPKRAGVEQDEESNSEMITKVKNLQQKLLIKERQLEDDGANQQERIKVLEMLLKDREHLSQHAREMWMKETERASQLTERLEEADQKNKDLEKKLKELSEMYNEASQEVRQLKHWFSSQDGYVPSSTTAPDGGPRSKSSPAKNAWNTSPNLNGSRRIIESPRGGGGGYCSPSSKSASRKGDHFSGFGRERYDDDRFGGAGNAGLDAPREESNNDRFRHLCVVNDAILYEDDVIQIGIKSSFRDLEGEMFVYFGNKHAHVLQNLQIDLTCKDKEALKVTWTTPPAHIEPKQQICQRLNVQAMAPFSEEPRIRVQFFLADGSPRRMQSPLPITINKFLRPCDTISCQEYLSLWREVEFHRNEISNVCQLSRRFGGRLGVLAKCATLGNALKLLVGVDPSPDNFVLAGLFPGDFPSTVLVRLEVGTGSFKGKARIAVRSDSVSLARAACNAIQSQISVVNNEAC